MKTKRFGYSFIVGALIVLLFTALASKDAFIPKKEKQQPEDLSLKNDFYIQNFIRHIHDICHSENPLRQNRNLVECFKLHDYDYQANI